MNFAFTGERNTPALQWLADGLEDVLRQHGYRPVDPGTEDVRLVLNFTGADKPEPHRRRSQATFVVSVIQVPERPDDILRTAYPLLVKSLSNLLIFLVGDERAIRETYFVTLERGYYTLAVEPGDEAYFARMYERLAPLASSRLVIRNEFVPDLPRELWEGDEVTEQLRWASKKLEELDLLPAPFPIQEILSERDFRHVQHLYGIGGLSYGNLSARHGPRSYWMSASGVNKARLETIGRDILLVTGYDPEKNAMILSVPPHVEPRRVSVDAIEHWMIYTTHPEVKAIVHVHAWMEGVPSTEVNYPCGTYELASAVADLVNRSPDPACAVVGLKNHGLTITGRSLPEIFSRIEGKILRQVPMS
ncbi:MAG: class II aldolase/adducin family protein [Firmicutes bacterium]|nr:class II aldolase/adducin family protein [Bacillota bacterium]